MTENSNDLIVLILLLLRVKHEKIRVTGLTFIFWCSILFERTKIKNLYFFVDAFDLFVETCGLEFRHIWWQFKYFIWSTISNLGTAE